MDSAIDELVRRLEDENADLRRQLAKAKGRARQLEDNLAKKNRELDALHYVWCSGGCEGGVHRHFDKELTAKTVASAVRNTDRLVQWYINHAGSAQHGGVFKGDWDGLRAAWKAAVERIQSASLDALKSDNERLREAAYRVMSGYVSCGEAEMSKRMEDLRAALAQPDPGEKQ